jgi:hypothetical protein
MAKINESRLISKRQAEEAWHRGTTPSGLFGLPAGANIGAKSGGTSTNKAGLSSRGTGGSTSKLG